MWRDPRRYAISPWRPSEENTRMDRSHPWNCFCTHVYISKLKQNKQFKLYFKVGFCLFCFSNFTFDFHGFLNNVENNSLWCLNWCTEENLVVNNKDNTVFLSWNYRSDSCALEIWCSWNTVLLISTQWLGVILKIATFLRFLEVLKEHLETNE